MVWYYLEIGGNDNMLVREPKNAAWRGEMWIQLKLLQLGLNMPICDSSPLRKGAQRRPMAWNCRETIYKKK